jgi:hypothetical protein
MSSLQTESNSFFSRAFSSKAVPWWVLLLTFLLCVGFTFRRHRLGDNVLSRLITVERLLEKGTFAHNGTRFPLSIDSIKVRGRLYSSKPANLSLLMTAQAWIWKQITGFQFYEYQRFYTWLLVLGTQVLPFLLMLWCAFWLVRRFSDDVRVHSLFLLVMSAGSLAMGYSVTLNNHLPAAVCLFLSFVVFVRIRLGEWGEWWACVLFGFLGSLGATFDLPGGIFPALFCGLLLFSPQRKKLGWVLLGAMLPLGTMLGMNFVISGSPRPFYLQGALYRYEGSYWVELGTRAAANQLRKDSKGIYVFHSLLGHHGLFSLTPLFFLVPFGLWKAFKQRWEMRHELAAIVLGSLVIMAFIFVRTSNYGGICVGMRWFVVFMPLLMVAVFPVLKEAPSNPRLRWVVLALLFLSCLPVMELLNSSVFSTSIWEEFIFIQTGIDAAVH